MKLKVLPIFILIVISLFFLAPLFQDGFYQSHDGEAHVARFAAYYSAYSDGQFPARWAGNLNLGFGSPVFIFYYPLPGTLASLIHYLGISFESSFKILIGASFILSAISFYIWLSSSKGVRKDVAFIGALLYGLAPYHFLDIYVRGDVAEMMALAFAPFVFMFIEKLARKPTLTAMLLGTITYALLILSHNALSLMFSVIILFYIILKYYEMRNKNLLYYYVSILVLGLGLSSLFWLPALYETKFTNAALFIGDMYKNHFPPLLSLIYSSWGFGSDVNKLGGLSPQIGVIQVTMVVLGMTLMLIKRKFDKEKIFWILIFGSSVFMTISASTVLWENLPLIKSFQFPWRFTALSSFAASVMAVLVLNTFYSKRLIIVLALVVITLSFPLSQVASHIQAKGDEYYASYKGTTDYHGQASTIWTAGDPGKEAKALIEIIGGEGIVSDVVKKSNKHTFVINAKSDVKIVDNTIYFPSWQVRIDGEKVTIEFQDINHRGLITFPVPQGPHKIEVTFRESPIRLLSDIISFVTLIFIAGIWVFRDKVNNILARL